MAKQTGGEEMADLESESAAPKQLEGTEKYARQKR